MSSTQTLPSLQAMACTVESSVSVLKKVVTLVRSGKGLAARSRYLCTSREHARTFWSNTEPGGSQRVMVSKVYALSACTFWSKSVPGGRQRTMISHVYILNACTFWSNTVMVSKVYVLSACPFWSNTVMVSKVYILSACPFWSNIVMVRKVYGISASPFWSNTVPGGSHRTTVSKV